MSCGYPAELSAALPRFLWGIFWGVYMDSSLVVKRLQLRVFLSHPNTTFPPLWVCAGTQYNLLCWALR
jgi:hypothetical protein